VAEFFNLARWSEWLSGLDRSFLFLLILPFVVAAVGFWAHYWRGTGDSGHDGRPD
jgi:hypothetical protein